MTLATWIGLCAGALAMAALLRAEVRDRPVARALAKTACSLSFVAVALSGGIHGRYAALLLTGLLLSTAGDVLLLSRKERAFLGGLVSFLLAHVAYAAAFAPVSSRSLLLLPLVVPTLAGILAWLWPHLGSMRLPVLAYCAVIGVMVWLGMGVPDPRVRVGALLFFVSDLFVARGRFVHPGKVNQIVGWPLYYGGQFLLALSVG